MFLSVLKTKNIKVSHIDNPTYHLNLETSILFLDKTRTAIENLVLIVNSGKFPNIESKINSAFIILKRLKLVAITAYIFNKTESKIISNLLSKKPSLSFLTFTNWGIIVKFNPSNYLHTRLSKSNFHCCIMLSKSYFFPLS